MHIRVFPLNVRIGSIHGRCRLAREHTRCSQLIGTYADRHYDVTAFRHLSNPIQHLRRSGRCRDHYHLWFRSIGVRVVRYDLHSARETDRLGTVRDGIKLKDLHVIHARATGLVQDGLEDRPRADNINRLSPSPYDESDRYLAVCWRNQLGGRYCGRARRLLGKFRARPGSGTVLPGLADALRQ